MNVIFFRLRVVAEEVLGRTGVAPSHSQQSTIPVSFSKVQPRRILLGLQCKGSDYGSHDRHEAEDGYHLQLDVGPSRNSPKKLRADVRLIRRATGEYRTTAQQWQEVGGKQHAFANSNWFCEKFLHGLANRVLAR